MLIDQKMNDGISVQFFGHNAMTAPAAAQFAIRDNIPLLPVRCERLGGTKFRISFYPPIWTVHARANLSRRDIENSEVTPGISAIC